MKTLFIKFSVIFAVSLLATLLLNYILVLNNQAYSIKIYGKDNFSGWFLSDSAENYYLTSRLTADADGLYEIKIPLKPEVKINPLTKIYSSFKFGTEHELTNIVVFDIYSQDLSFQIDTSILIASNQKTYDISLIIQKDQFNTIPVYNKKPLITAYFKQKPSLVKKDILSYLKTEITEIRLLSWRLIRPHNIMIICVLIVVLLLFKYSSIIDSNNYEVILISINVPIVTVLSLNYSIFSIFVYTGIYFLNFKNKSNLLFIASLIYMCLGIIYFSFFNQAAGNRLTLYSYMCLAIGIFLNLFQKYSRKL